MAPGARRRGAPLAGGQALRKPRPPRPGDVRHSVLENERALRELGWKPKHKFEEAIKTTIQWYKDHQSWWRSIKSGDYLKYYETQYANR